MALGGQRNQIIAVGRELMHDAVSSNTWKSFVDGSPLGQRSLRGWRSRSAKNLGAARTRLQTMTYPCQEVSGKLVKVGDDARVEERLLFGRGQLAPQFPKKCRNWSD